MISHTSTPKNYNPEPTNLAEAYDLLYVLAAEVGTIESQLSDKGREGAFEGKYEYYNWRKKANVALAMKLKQLESTKKWINSHGGKAPTEEDDNMKPENISLGHNQRLATNNRPDPDRIIENVCNTVMQVRSLKRRLYPFYKIANAAFDLAKEIGVDTNDPVDVLNQLVYWLDKAGYNVKEIDGYSAVEEKNDNESEWNDEFSSWEDDG